MDKDELFPQLIVPVTNRVGAYTFGGVRDLIQNKACQTGLGADVSFYFKPGTLDAA